MRQAVLKSFQEPRVASERYFPQSAIPFHTHFVSGDEASRFARAPGHREAIVADSFNLRGTGWIELRRHCQKTHAKG